MESPELALDRMLQAMHHRGPDDSGSMTLVPGCTFGMRRLAIFDPQNGRQPMRSVDGRFSLVFNGAIYNHAELRHELVQRGRSFRTHCDTEVLLEAWAEWGEDALARLRGMFAFAVWSHDTRELWLVRDPGGIKPLYLHQQTDGQVVFASEVKVLLASRIVPAEIDPRGLHAYLSRLGVPAPLTIYRHVESLRPGELLYWRDGQIARRIYWRLRRDVIGDRTKDRTEFIRELRERLEDSIRAHQLADVPVGTFLSGGLDSAVTTGLMARQSSGRLKTFSIGFPETDYSEAAAAAETAHHFGTDHHQIQISGADAVEALPDFLAALDQPTGDGFNTYLVSRAARAGGVTAALSGLGGDELFGGYPSFRDVPRIATWLPWWQRLPRPLRSAACRQLDRRGARHAKMAGMLEHAGDIHDIADLRREVLPHSLCKRILPTLDHGTVFRHPSTAEWRTELAGCDPLEIVSAWELRGYMVDVLLRDSDTFSMSASLELRVPFVDRPLIEWLWQQPEDWRISRDGSKAALAEATRDILPPALLSRRKRGFTLPFPRWMRHELKPFIEDTLATAVRVGNDWIDVAAVQSLWSDFRDGEDDQQWSRVWSLVVLLAFLQRPITR